MPTHKPPTLKTLLHAIHRDSQSWRGIGLLYAHKLSTPPAGESLLYISGPHGDGVWLGALSSESMAVDASVALRVNDIAEDHSLAILFLGALVGENTPALTSLARLSGASPLKILVVEDDPMTSKLVEQHLQKYGNVITTKNARQATANNNVNNPDVIFLDIHYHDDIYDGFDVLDNIMSVNPEACVIMFSADKNPETILRALSLGARGFITKPFNAASFAHYLTGLQSGIASPRTNHQ
jgi:CheY-like chemotaxis protein